MVAKTDLPSAVNGKLRAPSKISLACGERKPEGFFGIDIVQTSQTDMIWDLLEFPWPIKDSCVTQLECGHFVEHIPHWRPGWEMDGWWMFFSEVYRICKPGAICEFVHPYVMSGRAFWDPTHIRFIHEATWSYLNKEWREREKIDHAAAAVNFEVITLEGIGLTNEVMSKSHEAQEFMREHYWNVVQDIQVKLKVLR